MVDYSRAENSKNHRNSFVKMVQAIHKDIDALDKKYETIWNKLEVDRKILAASIEDSIKILKELKIKTEKPLNQYSRDEVPGIILSVAKGLSDEVLVQKEILIENAKTIESRNKFIKTKSDELTDLETKLSSYYVKEEDYDDEVVIDLSKYKKEKKEKESVEKVPTITEDLSDLVKNTFRIEDEEEVSYTRLRIEGNMSLEELANSYYGNKEYWTGIYYFIENKDIIDQLCNLYNMDIDTFKSEKNVLKGFELCFPKEIKVYESIPKGLSKAA